MTLFDFEDLDAQEAENCEGEEQNAAHSDPARERDGQIAGQLLR
jgi:hypothetical protein